MTDGPERVPVGDRLFIYQRGKKKTWVADFWRDGRHCRQSLKTANKKVAVRRAIELAAQLDGGTYQRPPEPTTVAEAAAAYLSSLKTEGRAAKTLVKYQGVFDTFVTFLSGQRITRLHHVTVTHFDQFRAERRDLGRGVKTLYTEGVIVKQVFRWARSRRLLVDNPLADVKLNKPKLAPRGGPSLDQVNDILAALADADRTPVAVLAFTGMRAGELHRLKPEDLDPAGNWLHVRSRAGLETKTRESRMVPVHVRLRPLLAALSRRPRPWVFIGMDTRKATDGDGQLNVKRLNERFLEVVKQLDLPAGRAGGGFTLHSLRHFFETFAVNARVPQRVVDTWLGHRADKSMAANYYRLADQESQRFMDEVPFGTGTPAANAGQEGV